MSRDTSIRRAEVSHRRVLMIGGVVCLLWASAFDPAIAHHGFGGSYDVSQAIYVPGRVVAVRIGMPHSLVTIEVSALPPSAKTLATLPMAQEFQGRLATPMPYLKLTLVVEFPPVARFLDLAPEIQINDSIAVIAFRNCFAPHQLRGQWIQLASGRVVVREGRMQSETQRCKSSAR
jgi:hypothetical protein